MYLYANFGVMCLVYLAWVSRLGWRLPRMARDDAIGALAVLAFLLGYGAALSILEDQIAALFLGAAAGMLWHARQQAYGATWSDPYRGALARRLRPSLSRVSRRHDPRERGSQQLHLVALFCSRCWWCSVMRSCCLGRPGRGSRSIWPTPRSMRFFVVSGFLITGSYERCHGLAAFYVRRIFRLYPMYLFVVLLQTAAMLALLPAGPFSEPHATLRYVAANAVLANFLQYDIGGVLSGCAIPASIPSLWTLKIEIGFYLIVPVIYLAARRWGPRVLAAIFCRIGILQPGICVISATPARPTASWAVAVLRHRHGACICTANGFG